MKKSVILLLSVVFFSVANAQIGFSVSTTPYGTYFGENITLKGDVLIYKSYIDGVNFTGIARVDLADQKANYSIGINAMYGIEYQYRMGTEIYAGVNSDNKFSIGGSIPIHWHPFDKYSTFKGFYIKGSVGAEVLGGISSKYETYFYLKTGIGFKLY